MKKLVIEKDAKVVDAKHAFEGLFEGLKIEFFRKSHDTNQSSSSKLRVLGTEQVSSICDSLPHTFELSEDMKVSELETLFEKKAGLHVQVFRKMRNIWIETVQTDNYTLGQQIELSQNSVTS